MIPDLQFSSFFFIQMPNIDKDPNWRVETFISFVLLHSHENTEFSVHPNSWCRLWWTFLHFSLIDSFEPHFIYLFIYFNSIV